MRTYRIGRDRGNDIVLDDASVSRRHAELRKGKDGNYILVDLQSTNGTCVRENGRWIEIEQASVDETERILLGEIITSVSDLVSRAIPAKPSFSLAGDMARRVRTEPSRRAPPNPAEVPHAEPALAQVASGSSPSLESPVPAWPASRRAGHSPPRPAVPPMAAAGPSRLLAPDRPAAPVAAGSPRRRTGSRGGAARWAAFLGVLLVLGGAAAYGYVKFSQVIKDDGAERVQDTAGAPDEAADAADGEAGGANEDATLVPPRPSMTGAAPGPVWQQVLRGPGRQVVRSAVPGSGGVFSAGSVESGDARGLWVARFSARGEPLWQRIYGAGHNASAASIYPMDDLGAIVAGQRETPDGRRVPWVLRLDSDGGILWQRTLGSLHSGVATFVTGIPGGIVVAAAIERQRDTAVAGRLVHLDSGGRILWTRTFSDGLTWPTGMRRTRDGGIVVVGVNKPRAEDTYVLWTARVDNDGALRWANRYALGEGEDGEAVVRRAARDEYIIATTHTRQENGRRAVDLRIVRLNGGGRMIWHHLHETPAPERAAGLILTPGGIIVAGSTENRSAGRRDLLVIRFDTRGRVVWERRYGGEGDDWATDLRQTRDRGLLAAGITDGGSGDRDGWILRLDGEGLLGE